MLSFRLIRDSKNYSYSISRIESNLHVSRQFNFLQARIPLEDVVNVVKEVTAGKMSWKNILIKYPKFEQQDAKSV